MKVYIASPFFNEEQLEVVKQIEAELEKEGIEYFSPRKDGVLKDMDKKSREEIAPEIYKKNIAGVRNCTAVIAVIDNFDPGTVFELGYAAAFDKKIITLSMKNYGLNVMLSQCVVVHALSVDGAVGALTGKTVKDVVFPETSE